MSQLKRITVLGSGVLGGQIAWHSAYKGKSAVVYDISETALANCRRAHAQYAEIYQAEIGASLEAIQQTQARLRYTCDLAEAVAEVDLVIEAVPEVPAIKTSVYQQMAPLLPAHTLIVTNSSTLLPRDFAAATGRPDKYCALHYANLIWRLNMVEIMAHPGTAERTLSEVAEFAIETGMVPIPVQKEQNGYVLNTWFVALQNAAQTLVTNGVATPEMVDRTFLINNPGSKIGPMGMMDVVGMKTVYDVCTYWGHVNQDAQMLANADYIKTHFLDKGKLGLQTGEGYYRYPTPAYSRPDFLAVPGLSAVPEIVRLAAKAQR
ncbi:3-hydroxyacyl-CoA dehydrogenase [Pseudomonas vranovensis]|uniref:3-hydroxyacyl-CoA dehydrogenase n=1 Tax=Pseudomonas vranovensis TaxID=321661 RepID=UPI003D954B4B